jgi:hypothetical protein
MNLNQFCCGFSGGVALMFLVQGELGAAAINLFASLTNYWIWTMSAEYTKRDRT